MLTVNIVGNGNQTTLEAKYVTADSRNSNFEHDVAIVHRPDGEVMEITNGQVFVMNEAGSTVARYDFRKPQNAQNDPEPVGLTNC